MNKNTLSQGSLIAILSLSLYSSSKLWAQDQQHSTMDYSPVILQSVANIEQFPSIEGNAIKLIQLGQTCQFEGVFYHETAKTVQRYTFKGQTLLKAQQLDYQYTLGGLSNLQDNHGQFDSILHSSASYETQLPGTQATFKIYRSLFPTSVLEQCKQDSLGPHPVNLSHQLT